MQLSPEKRQEAIKAAWEDGRLQYLLRNTQRKIKLAWNEARAKGFVKFYIEATRRLGKSSLLLMLFTEECRSKANVKCGFFAPVKDGLLDYIEKLIAITYQDCPDELRPYLDKTRFLLRFKHPAGDSVIVFRGSNNQQHRVRRGQEFNIAGVDEARDVDDLDELIDSVVMPSLFSTDGKLIISSTPADTRSHPLFEIRNIAKVEGWFIEIPIWEAHRLDPQIYPIDRINKWKEETLKKLDGQERWEREYECKWVVNRRKMAVPEWDSKTMVLSPGGDPYYQFYRRFHGLDWGYKDFTAIVFATLNFRKARLEFDGELTYSGKEVRSDLISERINLMNEDIWGKEFVRTPDFSVWSQVSDSADPILINELNKYKGMNFTPVKKAHTLEAMLNEFRVLVAQGKVVVRPSCQMLIHCLENGVWDNDRKKLDKDLFAHHFDHLMAAVYLTRMVDWNDNPIPRDFMIDGMRVIDLNFDKTRLDNDGLALQNAFGGSKRR